MQAAFSRALCSLRGALSTSSRLAARSFSDAAADAGAPLSKAAESEGAKAKLFRILGAAQEPLTAAQVWAAAEQEGLKSKRFAKQMLQQLKQAGWVKTQPLVGAGKKQKHFGYRLNQHRQQQREAKLAERAARLEQRAAPKKAAAGSKGPSA